MKKFFTVALMAVVAAFTASVAKAEISISGYQEFYAESVDQSTAAGLDSATQTDVSRNGLSKRKNWSNPFLDTNGTINCAGLLAGLGGNEEFGWKFEGI